MKIDSNMMGPRMSTNLSVERQTPRMSFGDRVQAGLNNAAGAVAGGVGVVAGMVPGGGVVSAAVSSLNTFQGAASPGAGSQYSGALSASASGINTGVPSLGAGGGGGGTGTVSGNATGNPLINGSGGGSVTGAIDGNAGLGQMFQEQKKLLGMQAAIQHESQIFTAISNVMKTRHDTIKNSISNVR